MGALPAHFLYRISEDFPRSPEVSYRISSIYTAFPYTAFLAAFLYIRHSHGIPGGMHSYGMLRHLYSMHAYNIRHACPYTTFLRQKKKPGGFPYAYERHASDMPTIDMPTTCIYTACLRHAYIYDMPIRHACLYDMPIRHAYIYDMLTTCLRHAYTRHAYDMLTTCLYGMPTTCLRHACLYDMHAYMASL